MLQTCPIPDKERIPEREQGARADIPEIIPESEPVCVPEIVPEQKPEGDDS